MSEAKSTWMETLRDIRDRQAQQMKGRSSEEQVQFVRQKAEKLHRRAHNVKS
jgi:hypothetical protein